MVKKYFEVVLGCTLGVIILRIMAFLLTSHYKWFNKTPVLDGYCVILILGLVLGGVYVVLNKAIKEN